MTATKTFLMIHLSLLALRSLTTPLLTMTVVEDDFVVDLNNSLLDDLVLPDQKEKTGIVDMEVV